MKGQKERNRELELRLSREKPEKGGTARVKEKRAGKGLGTTAEEKSENRRGKKRV